MAVLEIDGVGRVEVGNDFLRLPPERQTAEVDAIAAQQRPQAALAPAEPVPTPSGPPQTFTLNYIVNAVFSGNLNVAP